MRNKTFLLWIVITVLMVGCTTFATANTDIWLEYELPPSRINYSGKKIMEEKLADGSMFFVFYDEKIDNDSRYYYVILMQDFGWRLNGDTWTAPYDSRHTNLGYMYVNPKRQVAIYFYPEGTYGVFKVSIEKSTTN